MTKFIRLFLFFIFIIPFVCLSQNDISFLNKEKNILKHFEQLKIAESDSVKILRCTNIKEELDSILQIPSSFNYSFSSLKNLGKIYSPERKFRIFTWNCVLENGDYKYYGFLQLKNKKGDLKLLFLSDKGLSALNMTKQLLADSWNGALYYKIIATEKDKNSYLLLGWDGNNPITNKKVIEVLNFSKSGEVIFGKPIIDWRGKRLSRVVFEYSNQAQMHLKYDKNIDAVVFDHLSPSSSKYTNQFEYYGPDFSYDVLQSRKGIWFLHENVDFRNLKK